jgi:hypothetical protein
MSADLPQLPLTLKGVELNLATYSRFLYRTERRNGRWGIMGFDAIYIRDELTPAIPGQSITIDKNDLKDFRPTYRMLSYYLASRGYAVDSNLAGEDRPTWWNRWNANSLSGLESRELHEAGQAEVRERRDAIVNFSRFLV